MVAWNPHALAGVLELTSTDNIDEARRFTFDEAPRQLRMISAIQPCRPWDGEPNRPLTAVSIEIINAEGAAASG